MSNDTAATREEDMNRLDEALSYLRGGVETLRRSSTDSLSGNILDLDKKMTAFLVEFRNWTFREARRIDADRVASSTAEGAKS